MISVIDVGTILWDEKEKEGEVEEKGRKKRKYEGLRQMEAWEGNRSSSESDDEEEEDEEDDRSSDMELSNDGDTVGQLYLQVGKS